MIYFGWWRALLMDLIICSFSSKLLDGLELCHHDYCWCALICVWEYGWFMRCSCVIGEEQLWTTADVPYALLWVSCSDGCGFFNWTWLFVAVFTAAFAWHTGLVHLVTKLVVVLVLSMHCSLWAVCVLGLKLEPTPDHLCAGWCLSSPLALFLNWLVAIDTCFF
jgi:hypothetical protein